MNFLDKSFPKKYDGIKNLLKPYEVLLKTGKSTLKRYGKNDGSYILVNELVENSFPICLSYGIGSDPCGVSFETAIAPYVNMVYMYDGSIDYFPTGLDSNMVFTKEYLNKDNFQNHIKDYNDVILKMDIEGSEYDWLSDENMIILENQVSQFCVEVHSLIEEIPYGWILDPATLDAKQHPEKVVNFFEKLNKSFTIVHMHGNNHSPLYGDLPDCLEITYVNNKHISSKEIRKEAFPILGMDEPNLPQRGDYLLNWWNL